MDSNICKFIHTAKADDTISILSFVYEKEAAFKQDFITTSAYSMALVTGGTGILHTSRGNFELVSGTVFFTFSAKPYFIENTGSLQYLYISFMGLRALALLERLPISYAEPVSYGHEALTGSWAQTFDICRAENADLLCEGLLLHAMGILCRDDKEADHGGSPSGILLAKQYVDACYTDPRLNLRSVSRRFSYDPKYFSAAFKRMVRIGFSEYLKNCRLNYAVTLMQSGITNVSDLAELCGYTDPFYFSKCFKQQFGASPKKWLSEQPKSTEK